MGIANTIELAKTSSPSGADMKVLEVTTNVGCPVKCSYCPQDAFLKAYGDGKKVLSLTDFTTALNKIPEGAEVVFSGFSEPWKNKNCTEMVLRSHAKGHKVTVYTTLVGMKFDDVEKMKDVPFAGFCVHLPSIGGSESIPIENEYLGALGYVKRLVKGVTFAAFGLIDEKISAIVGNVPFSTTEMMASRCGLVPKCGKGLDRSGPIRCHSQDTDMLDHNVLLPDGRVVLCCMDFGMKYVLGNLLKQDYESLFTGKVADKVRAGLRGEKQVLCHKCEYGIQQ
jgi:hypothetical protein